MGAYFEDAIIQQLGGLDRKYLPLLKDFGHLMVDAEPVLRDGYYIFSVPELKLARMSNACVRNISRLLGELDKKVGALVCLSRENVAANRPKVYGLKLPEGFDIDRVRAQYGKVFGGQTWEEASAEYDARKDSLKKRAKYPGECLEPVSVAEAQVTSFVRNPTDKLSTLQQKNQENISNEVIAKPRR